MSSIVKLSVQNWQIRMTSMYIVQMQCGGVLELCDSVLLKINTSTSAFFVPRAKAGVTNIFLSRKLRTCYVYSTSDTTKSYVLYIRKNMLLNLIQFPCPALLWIQSMLRNLYKLTPFSTHLMSTYLELEAGSCSTRGLHSIDFWNLAASCAVALRSTF